MRLFVGVRPPPTVLDHVSDLVTRLQGSLGGRSRELLRWCTRDQWHLTLRFLGEVDDPEPVTAALGAASLLGAEAVLGPVAQVLGSKVLCVPAAGLDELAAGVVAATASFGRPSDDRRFHAHLTLARRKGRSGHSRMVKRSDLDGVVIEERWLVDEVTLVRSHLGPGGARYEDLYVRRLPSVEA